MKLKGTLHVESGESSINGRLLAIQGDPDPFGAATDFLANRNLFDGDPAEITGEEGTVGTRNVVFMTNAVPLAEEAEAASPMAAAVGGAKSALKAGAKKSAKKAGKKSAKKTGTKKSAKKTGKKSAKKTGAKKSAKKAGTKKSASQSGTKKSAKKRTRKPTARKSAKKARRKK